MVNSDINGSGVRGNILQNFESILVQFPIACAAGCRRQAAGGRQQAQKQSKGRRRKHERGWVFLFSLFPVPFDVCLAKPPIITTNCHKRLRADLIPVPRIRTMGIYLMGTCTRPCTDSEQSYFIFVSCL